MRRIVAFSNLSADGYFVATDGSVDWVVPDEEMDRYVADAVRQSGADTILFGRRTYQMFPAFWPNLLDEIPKIVFSRRLKQATWQSSRIVRELDPREIETMKMQHGGDMMVFGSGSIVTLLAAHRLIDEYQIVVNPVLLGAGRPLISGGLLNHTLDLAEEKRFPSGKLLLRYTLAKVAAPAPEPEEAREAPRKTAKKASAGSVKAADAALLRADAALATIVGSQPIARTQAMNKLLSYIKRKGLQDKQNRRMVNADDALRPLFGGKSHVSMNDLPALVEKHLKRQR